MTDTNAHTGTSDKPELSIVLEFIIKLRREFPKATNAEIVDRGVDAFRSHLDQEAEWYDLGVALIRTALRHHLPDPKPRTVRTAEQRAESKAAEATLVQQMETGIEKMVEERAATRFLEMATPNGRLLRDCTGAMCKRFGGFYAEIGKRLKASEHVGGHMTEAEVAAIAKTWRVEDC